MTEQAPIGGWIAYERDKRHWDTDGWCRCCCDHCAPHGCSHISNPAPCPAHPRVPWKRR